MRQLMLSRSAASLRPGAARIPELLRFVGTQTPLWRERQEAIAKVGDARRALQKMQAPAGDLRCNLRLSSREMSVEEASAGASVEELVARAFMAAEQGNELECASLIFSVKELPRSSLVRQAVDTPRGESRRTLLQEVSAKGFERPASILLDMAADVTKKDERGRTALHMAVMWNHGKVAQLLLARGRASVQARDADGRTPLHLATDRGNKHAARVLVRFGADPNAVDGQGRKVVDEKVGRNESKNQNRSQLVNWMKTYVQRRDKTSENLGKVRYFKGLGTELPSHIVAPKLELTNVGYCPVEDGKVVQLPRGIRVNKRRRGPSAPKCKVNWYAPRG